MRLADLYLSGGHQEAWDKLTERCKSDPTFAATEEAEHLAHLTFERVSRNVDRLINGLRRVGYRFECEDPEYGTASLPRQPASPESLAKLSSSAWPGPLPLAIRICAEVVGNVDLRQSWDRAEADGSDPVLISLGDWDPFCFEPDYLPKAIEAGIESSKDTDDSDAPPERPVEVAFAPDLFHKAGVSGADGYLITLPGLSPDPLVIPGFSHVHEYEPVRFTTYLRQCFSRGGFFGSPELIYDRGHGWLGKVEVAPGLFLPNHPIFSDLARELESI